MKTLTIETINEMEAYLSDAVKDMVAKTQPELWTKEEVYQWVDDETVQFLVDIEELGDDDLCNEFCDVRNDASFEMCEMLELV